MAVKILMPKGSDTMTEGKVLKWLKKEGEEVSTGDTVVEIETDKVDMEVEAMGGGVLRKILVEPGKVVPVGELLAVVGKPDEDIAALIKPDGAKAAAEAALAPAKVEKAVAPAAPAAPPATGGPMPARPGAQPTAAPPAPAETGGRVLASPLARRLAREMGVDLSGISGSGPGGRVIRQDVEQAAAAGPARRPTLIPGGPEYQDQPLSSMRKVIAARLVQSKAPVPHFYLTIEADMRQAKALRESANGLNPELKLSYNDIIMKACAAALRQHPEVNTSFQGESIRYHNRVHIGMAVAIEGGGLVTPVIRDCDRKSLEEISREARELATRARNRKLNPDEYVGSTFSVSNLGMMGIEEFSAVINPPEGAILAVGSVAEKPVVADGRIEVGLRCRMTMSCDHRVIDGATGARFLQTLKRILENPGLLAL
jgi:pyruvate dehydrogenase E2 component (dihydrolipoamide acetyltransferase)